MDAPSPERGPEILPRHRGMADQAYQLALQPYRYSSAEEVPVVHQDGSSRHCILVLVGSRNLKATTTFWIGSLFSPVAASAASSSPSERKRERERETDIKQARETDIGSSYTPYIPGLP